MYIYEEHCESEYVLTHLAYIGMDSIYDDEMMKIHIQPPAGLIFQIKTEFCVLMFQIFFCIFYFCSIVQNN